MYFDYRDTEGQPSPAGKEFLEELDDYLRPARLSDKVRTYVCDVGHQQFSVYDELDDGDESGSQESSRKAAERAHHLGVNVCSHPDVLDEISQDLFTGEFGFRIEFGRGMASTCTNPKELWDRLIGYLESADARARNCLVLCGVLDVIHERDPALARAILAEGAADRTLRPVIVTLHHSVPMSRETLQTLLSALDFDDTPLDQFAHLATQPAPGASTEAFLRDLFLKLLDKPRGVRVVLAGLSMRIRAAKDGEPDLGPDLKQVGLLASVAMLRDPAHHYGGPDDRHLARVLGVCLDDTVSLRQTDEVAEAFLARVKNTGGMTGGLHASVAMLARKIPFRFLDDVFLSPDLDPYHRRELFAERHRPEDALFSLDTATQIEWCRTGDFQKRLTMLSQAIHPFARQKEGGDIAFSEQAHAIINFAHDTPVVLDNFANSVQPSGWSGSLAEIIEARLRPFEALLQESRREIRSAVESIIPRIREWERCERKSEQREDRERDQRFE